MATPGSPLARLREARKQVQLAHEALDPIEERLPAIKEHIETTGDRLQHEINALESIAEQEARP